MSLKKFLKKAGKAIGKAKNVLLPIAGVAAGLALPGVGGVIGKVLNKGKDLLGKAKAAKESAGGFLGIGDKKPGILGIGTGKGLAKVLGGKDGEDGSDGADGADGAAGAAGTPGAAAGGIPSWVKLAGGALAVYALAK